MSKIQSHRWRLKLLFRWAIRLLAAIAALTTIATMSAAQRSPQKLATGSTASQACVARLTSVGRFISVDNPFNERRSISVIELSRNVVEFGGLFERQGQFYYFLFAVDVLLDGQLRAREVYHCEVDRVSGRVMVQR